MNQPKAASLAKDYEKTSPSRGQYKLPLNKTTFQVKGRTETSLFANISSADNNNQLHSQLRSEKQLHVTAPYRYTVAKNMSDMSMTNSGTAKLIHMAPENSFKRHRVGSPIKSDLYYLPEHHTSHKVLGSVSRKGKAEGNKKEYHFENRLNKYKKSLSSVNTAKLVGQHLTKNYTVSSKSK